MVLVLVGAAGILFASGSGLACTSLFGEQGMGTADLCFIFDCQNGALGGAIDFCSDSPFESPLFTDCPDAVPEGDGGGGDGGGGGGF